MKPIDAILLLGLIVGIWCSILHIEHVLQYQSERQAIEQHHAVEVMP